MMNPVPIEVRLVSGSESEAAPSVTSPRTCTTAARARSARSANAEAVMTGLWRGALVHSGTSRSAAAGGDHAAQTPAVPAARRRAPAVRRIAEAYAIARRERGRADPESSRDLIGRT